MSDYIDEVFGAGGLLARKFPGYEPRPGQVSIARAVDTAMREGRHCLAEGPTGTGKTLAYLVPAIRMATERGERTIVVTANIALQEQLSQHDLPLLHEILPEPFTHAVLKGRSNFLCHDRLNRVQGELLKLGTLDRAKAGEGQTLEEALVEWALATERGDSSELPWEPEPRLWSRFSVSADECRGPACRFRAECRPDRAQAQAGTAHVVVTNYAMLFLHLILMRETEGRANLLGDHRHLVLDEGHKAADLARDHYGFEVALGGLKRLASRLRGIAGEEVGDRVEERAARFFAAAGAHARTRDYSVRLRRAGFAGDSAPQLADALRVASSLAKRECATADLERQQEARLVARAAKKAGERVAEVGELSDAAKVYWVEDGPRPRICARVVDVAPLLREDLFGGAQSVTVTSATLAIGGSFDFVRRELGVPEQGALDRTDAEVELDIVPAGRETAEGPIEVVAPSPFDHASQALLVLPRGLPQPSEQGFAAAGASVLRAVMESCGGRTLGLFTSYRSLDAFEAHLKSGKPMPWRVLRQGAAPRSQLAKQFREDEESCLLGCESFWTGLDVPGDACVAVVVDKLPFPHVGDPVIDALSERAGKRAFDEVMVPRAVVALRQGVGRLIRSRGDIGVVVLLDRRVVEKGYGAKFLRVLPPMRATRDLADIPGFLAQARGARGAA